MNHIAVLVIAGQPVLREGLRALLAAAEDVRLLDAADSCDAAAAVLASRRADVVVLDLDPDGEGGLGLGSRVAELAPDAKVLAFTESRDPRRHRAALLAGFRGVVTKDKPGEAILKAVRKVAAGELWFERHVLERTVTDAISRGSGRAPQHDDLTEREREIVSLISEGLRNAEIAARLGISKKTVCNHLTSVFGKLGVSDRLGLLVHAQQRGLVPVPRRAPSVRA